MKNRIQNKNEQLVSNNKAYQTIEQFNPTILPTGTATLVGVVK